ncbi:MAG TPA: hypothetical protein VK658_15020 [Chryseolinea sp.]|nr:hypothetical protein [Chryseolinea sp.]
MARRKKPVRQRWTTVKNSMLYFAWAEQKRPDSFARDFIRFVERALSLDDQWLKGDGLREFEERNKKRGEARARYRKLFDEKYSDLMALNDYPKEDEFKEIRKFLDDQDILKDEFHIRNNQKLAALFFLLHARSRDAYSECDKLTPPYTTLN